MTEEVLDKLTDFIIKYLPYKDRDLIKHYINTHKDYQTMDYAIDDRGEIVGVCRWNIKDETTAHILDLAIRPDFRGKGVARNFLKRGLHRWKNVTHLVFERGSRGDIRERRLPIEEVLRRKFF